MAHQISYNSNVRIHFQDPRKIEESDQSNDLQAVQNKLIIVCNNMKAFLEKAIQDHSMLPPSSLLNSWMQLITDLQNYLGRKLELLSSLFQKDSGFKRTFNDFYDMFQGLYKDLEASSADQQIFILSIALQGVNGAIRGLQSAVKCMETSNANYHSSREEKSNLPYFSI